MSHHPTVNCCAIDNEQNVATSCSVVGSGVIPSTDRSLRQFSKKSRVYVLREFLLDTYGGDDGYISAGDVVLDVAGGKGDLSWLLYNVDDIQSIVVDPRQTINHIDKSVSYLRLHPHECQIRSVRGLPTYQPIAGLMQQLQAKNFDMHAAPHLRIFVDEELIQAVQKVVKYLSSTMTTTAKSKIIAADHTSGGGFPSSNALPMDCIQEWIEYWDNANRRTVGFVTPTGKNDVVVAAAHILNDAETAAASSATVPSTENNHNNNNSTTITDGRIALDRILQAKLVVGFHPDQATDYCFQLARLLQIPVCVVPCCVFPSEFPYRRIIYRTTTTTNDDDEEEEEDDDTLSAPPTKKVEKYNDLIQYLHQEYSPLLSATLDFPGTTTARNMVLYTLPSSHKHMRE